MGFEFYTAPRFIFESGSIKKLPSLVRGYGKHFLIVTGGSSLRRLGVLGGLMADMEANGLKCTVYDGAVGEPTPEIVDAAVKLGLQAGADAVIGIGGGSAMDTAKAAAGVIPNGGSVRDYLEGVGSGAKVIADPLPFIAVPTTAGTGTEVTKNAVIMSTGEHFKASMRDSRLMARLALVDPELTLSVPPAVTAASGMDAICQLIESLTTTQANPFCDAMVLYHAPRAMAALRRAYKDGNDLEARETMSLAALVSGMCLANTGLGAAHGIGAGLGAVLGVAHGVACGMLLPHVMRYNTKHGVTKYAQLAKSVCGRSFSDDKAASMALANAVAALCADLGLPERLDSLGVTQELVGDIVDASMGSSMKKNPVTFTHETCQKFILSLI